MKTKGFGLSFQTQKNEQLTMLSRTALEQVQKMLQVKNAPVSAPIPSPASFQLLQSHEQQNIQHFSKAPSSSAPLEQSILSASSSFGLNDKKPNPGKAMTNVRNKSLEIAQKLKINSQQPTSAQPKPPVKKTDPLSHQLHIYVGNLHPDTTEQTVKAYFSTYGEVADVYFPGKKHPGIASRFAFVTFARFFGDHPMKPELKNSHWIGGR